MKSRQMSYKETVSDFMDNIHPHVVKKYGWDDEIAINESWNNYVDALAKSGDIPEEGYEWELK